MIGLVEMLNASPFSALSGGIFETVHCYYSLFLTREEKNLASEMNFLVDSGSEFSSASPL